MIGLRRTAAVRLKYGKSVVVAFSRLFSEHPKAETSLKGKDRGVRKFLPSLPAEHFRLENKHRDALESNKAESLREIIE
ncbi:hypothetical protein KIN20_030763, partial [Parelaphostrongylus tenuis]